MRWKPKAVETASPGVPTRQVTRFALWPTRCEDIDGHDVMVWLEFYTAYQEIAHYGYGWPQWRTLTRFAQ